MKAYRLILLAGTLGIALALSACNPTSPSRVNLSKLKVKDQTVTETLDTGHVDLKHVALIAHKVLHHGDGSITLTMPYPPGGANRAGDVAAAYKKAFAAQGVTHVAVALVAMTDRQDADEAVASYQVVAAVQPNDCGRMTGYQGTGTMEEADEYQYGCETQANLSKMIADPTDLLGTAPPSEANSQRNGIIIDPYMTGKPNQPLKGMTASSIGAQ